jgi:uncharacterized protein YecT (DUF1311 family)
MTKYFLFFLILFSFSSYALADNGCGNPRNAYDSTYCTAKLFIESDKELNQVYSDLTNSISPDVKKGLVKTQRQWIKYRDSACSENGTIEVDCNFKINKERTTYLNDRLRECKVGHCQNDLIIKNNFS